ncbi:GntR family transcriptional regulator [Massilia yuzhufengensis]|uniref:DNA-binding transcriptional regulator, GntR family n=1 Tax=Massilia yuzhufengensis TaxID=1164594 RepID=A0A1I1EQH7_9BURK|nr:GntR family transcriptional regulator [Massilia yuzhufengensis]SFB88946.1 DNA-binding transcriptional regulator, GntR family [Massilia yuzhufengensis]
METIAFSGPFILDRSRHAAVQVYEYLREEIVNLVLKPGAVLSRSELAAHFRLSVTPIRDALTRLEEEGLVDIYPQHATRVRGISIDSARQTHFLRLSVELEIVRTLAASHDAALDAALASLVQQQKAALKARDMGAFSRADHAFHRQLYSAAEVEDLWRLMRGRSGNMDRLRRLHLPLTNKAASILKDHADIAAAIAASDAPRAEAALRRHLSGTMSELDALRRQFPDYWMPGPEA